MFKIIAILCSLIPAPKRETVGIASWYSVRDNHGTRTSSQIPLSDSELTAASRTIKNGTKVRVTNLSNGRAVFVRITDHGPNCPGRILDVSVRAAKELGFYEKGLQKVKVEIL